jgi:protein-disulfide isomerase
MTSSFPELTKSFGIQSVPALVVDGKKETLKTGVIPLPELISYIKSSI